MKIIWLKYLLILLIINSYTELNAQLRADFSATPSKGCAPLTVVFSDNSSGAITRREYTFGNGNQSLNTNPSAIYYQPGRYTVKLKVWDNAGNVDSVIKTNFIQVFKNPTAALTADKRVACAGTNISFTDRSTRGDANLTAWEWDFGDGGTVKTQNPGHVYQSGGLYNITLVVKDANGCENTTVVNQYIRIVPAPKASFTVDKPYHCSAPHTVSFTNTSTSAYGMRYAWNFGDGNTSTQQSPSNTYNRTGKFTVTLTVTNDSGCVNVFTIPDAVQIQALKPEFSAPKTKLCGPGDINFLNETDPVLPGATYEWNFGDGTTSLQSDPKHKYTKPGKYDVSLTVTKGSCKETMLKKEYIEILVPPSPAMILSDTLGCKVPYTINYENKAPNIVSYEWQFGDATSSTYGKYFKIYNKEGEFLVRLKVTDKNNCAAESAQKIRIEKIKARFFCDTTGCEMKKINFRDSSTSPYKLVKHLWRLGADTSSQTPPDFFELPAGNYIASLLVKDEKGCTDSFKRLVRIGKHTKPDFEASPLVVCNHDIVTFKNKTPIFPVTPDMYIWEYGDGQSDTVHNHNDVQHSYRVPPGYKTVRLISVHNTCPDTFTRKNYIKILAPYAHFTVEYDSCKPVLAKIIKRSVGDTRFEWEIDGVKNSTDSVISKPLTPNSVLQVKLKVWNDQTNCWDELEQKISIGYPVQADFNFSGGQCSPATISFNNLSKWYASCKWYFTPADTSVKINPGFVFKSSGSYKIVLKVKASNGCRDSVSKILNVSGPNLAFNVTPTKGCAPHTIQLYDSTWYAGKKGLWYFGTNDSVELTAQTMQYSIQQAGDIKVGLKATDGNGCQSSKDIPVSVSGVNASFNTTEYKDCLGSRVMFTLNLSAKERKRPHSVKYDFGDGTTSTSEDLYHTYNTLTQNVYNVGLYYTDSAGCVTLYTKQLVLSNKRIRARFTADTTGSFCPPLAVHFKDLSETGTGPITEWEWKFGDGTYSKLQHPGKIYLVPGSYPVSLRVKDGKNCADSFTIPDFIIVKGPVGSYTFDKDSGCVPLTVSFKSTTQRASETKWDMGDGNLSKLENLSHTYTYPGRFIPLLILSDTFGCTYTLPPIDTINVYPYPAPDFAYTGRCREDSIRFSYTGDNKGIDIRTIVWDFGDGVKDSSLNPVHLFSSSGLKTVTVTVTNRGGCMSSISKKVKLYGIDAAYTSDMPYTCLGTQVMFTDQSVSDTGIVMRRWFIDGKEYTGQAFSHAFNKKGFYDIRLIAVNSAGCKDTLFRNAAILVGDTLKPEHVPVYRVSVTDDHTVEIKFARSSEPDFKSYRVYIENNTGAYTLVKESYNVNDTVLFIPGLVTLKNSYCMKLTQKNICGFESDLNTIDKHCTVEVSGKPGINVSYLKWNAYYGWDEIKEYHVYRENLSVKGQFDSIGRTAAAQLWYNDSNIRCYNDYRYKIKAVEKNGFEQHSWSDTCRVKPTWINAVPANEVWRATVENNRDILLEWVELSKPRIPIVAYQVERSANLGLSFSVFKTLPVSEASMLDKAVKVNEKSYIYRIRQIDECGDLSPYSNIGKSILLKAEMNADFKPALHWSAYRDWLEGVDHYLVEHKQPDGSFRTIGRTHSGADTTFTDETTSNNCQPDYTYRVIGVRRQPADPDSSWQVISVSNEATAPVESKLWVPNAFSPDNNHINESFAVQGLYIKKYSIEIYNRWGEKLFETHDCIQNWDGYYMGEKVHEGVYLYKIRATGADNKLYNLEGTFTLFR